MEQHLSNNKKKYIENYQMIDNLAQDAGSPQGDIELFPLKEEKERLSTTPFRNQYTESDDDRSPKRTIRTTNFARMMNEEKDDDVTDFENAKISKWEFQKLQIADIIVALSALLGIVLTIMTYDLEYDQQNPDLLNYLLWFVFWTGLLTVFLNMMRHFQKMRYRKSRNLLYKKATIFSTGAIWTILFESVIILIQPYPWMANIQVLGVEFVEDLDIFYFLNDFFCVLIMLRLFIVIRTILSFSIYLTPRAGRVASFYGADATYQYAIKCLMKKFPFAIVNLLFLASLVIFGHMLRICERPLERSKAQVMRMSDFWNCMWCVLLTMTTVGYGDFYSKTFFGRFITFVCCVWGVFVCSLLVVSLTNILQMDSAEEKSYLLLDKLQLRRDLRDQAARIVTNLMKVSYNSRKEGKESLEVIKKKNKELVFKIKVDVKEFKQTARQIKLIGDNGNMKEEVMGELNFIRKEMADLQKRQDEQHKKVAETIRRATELFQARLADRSFDRIPEQERSNIATLPS